MPRRRPAVAPPPPLRSRGAVPYVMLPPDPTTTTTTTTPVPNDWLMTSPAPTAAPPRPDTGNSDDFKTPLIIFFVTLLATVVTASFFGALYWFCIRKYFQPATSRTAAAPSSNLDVQMSDRLLPPGSVSRQGARGQVVILEDNCDGDADPEYQPYLHEPDELRQRSNFLLLPEYASQAGSAQANSASGDEDDPAPASRGRLNVHYSSNNITPQRKALVEWLNVVVSAYMEAQLAGVPLDPPVAPAMTRSLSPTSGVPSDRSDVNSDAAPRGGQNPVAKRLQYLKSRTSDSSASSKTQPSTTKANINDRSPPNGRPNDASGVHSAPSPLNMSPNNSGPTAVPLSQLLEVPLHATSAAGVPLPTPDTTPTTLDPGKKQHSAVAEHHSHSTGGGATSRHSPPKSQTTPRKILHDSSSSSSDRSASHTRLNRQQHRM